MTVNITKINSVEYGYLRRTASDFLFFPWMRFLFFRIQGGDKAVVLATPTSDFQGHRNACQLSRE